MIQRQKVKRKCCGERVKEERGERWLPRQQQPAFSLFINVSHAYADTIHAYRYIHMFSLFRLYLLCSVEFFRHTVYLPGFLQRVGCFSDVVAMLGSTGYTFNSVILLNFLI